MIVQTTLNSSWLIRMGLIIVFCGAWGLYSAYDAFYKYPHKNLVFTKYQEFKNADDLEGWDEYARSQGWPTGVPETGSNDEAGNPTPPHGPVDIYSNYVMAGACGLIALVSLAYLGLASARKPAIDEEALYCGGAKVPFGAVKSIDKAKWDKKGIAVVHYEQDGNAGACTLDDWKFRGATAVLDELEKRTGQGDQPPVEDEDE